MSTDPKTYLVCFETTVTIDAYVRAPNKKAAKMWGEDNVDTFIDSLDDAEIVNGVDTDDFEVSYVHEDPARKYKGHIACTVDKDGEEVKNDDN